MENSNFTIKKQPIKWQKINKHFIKKYTDNNKAHEKMFNIGSQWEMQM